MSTTDPTREPLDGLVNLRDLGGLPADEGMTTRSGVIYRSDAPHADDRVPEGMPQWPPAAVIDLRDAVEQEDEHPLAAVSRVHRIPLLEDIPDPAEVEDEDPLEADDTRHELTVLYQRILIHSAKKLVEVFRVAVETDGPVLIHCAAGKDRTGVSAALLLGAVGVRPDAVLADYVRTDRNMFRVLQRLNVAPELPPGVDEESVRELVSAPAEAMEAVLERFGRYDGGAAGWLKAHGVTDDELQRWRRRFLVPSA